MPTKEDYKKAGRIEVIKEMLDTIKDAFNKGTNAELADFLDVPEAKINNLRTGGTNSPKSVAELMKKLAIAVRKHAISNAYSPIAEILPLENRLSKQEKKYEMSIGRTKKEICDIEDKIKNMRGGIYIFYDSLGEAIYAGKTEEGKKNTLWDEMKSAYNRPRKSQKLYRFAGTNIQKKQYYLWQVAHYVSIYKVDKFAIKDFESLLIRSFPNDLSNVRMEKKLLTMDED